MNDDSPPPSNRNGRLLLAAAALAIVAGGVYWWINRNFVSTDDAYVEADVTMVAPRVAGSVTKVLVQDNQAVKTGDLMLAIDPADFETAVRQAEANLAYAKAELESARADQAMTGKTAPAGVEQAQAELRAAQAQAERAQADAERYQTLYAKDEVSKQALDQALTTARASRADAERAQANLDGAQTSPEQAATKQARVQSAEATVEQQQAALDQARLKLSYTQVLAPSDGVVTRKNVEPGSQVQSGTPVLALVGTTPWVIANFKETQLGRMRVGQPVAMTVDAFPGVQLHGRVDSVQAGTGSSFSLLPPENASGNFIKVVQRVPVKLVFDPAPPATVRLVPGMSVMPKVDVSGTGGQTLAVPAAPH
jgi:membrane fusion protein (multidrug efflux system)